MKKIFLTLLLAFVFSFAIQAKFYVIVSAYSSEQSAKKAVKNYMNKGFKKAKVLVSPDMKVFRVSVAEYRTYHKASQQISKFVSKRIIPIDSWTTDNTKLTGHELDSRDLMVRRIENLEKLLGKGSSSFSTSDLSDMDSRIITIENSVNQLLNKLEQIELDFNTVQDDQNKMLNDGGGSLKARDNEITEIKRQLNDLKLLAKSRRTVKPKVTTTKDTKTVVTKKVVPIKSSKPVSKPKAKPSAKKQKVEESNKSKKEAKQNVLNAFIKK